MDRTQWKLISQGAEARVFESTFCNRKCIIKERFKKSYRLPELDQKLSNRRLLAEARVMLKCRKVGVKTPCIYMLDIEDNNRIIMEKLDGTSVKEYFFSDYAANDNSYSKEALQVAFDIGTIIQNMHTVANVTHGDLTTSNMFINIIKNDITMIDFGLANSSSPLDEDKAVDLYVMERAIYSTHLNSEVLVSKILQGYTDTSSRDSSVLKALEKVRRRGRKRTMIG